MKIRNGFVSNSSSSSFCIYGTSMDISEMIEKVKESNLFDKEEIESLEKNEDFYEISELVSEKTGLSTYVDYDNDGFWIGKEWSSIGDDETGSQFKSKIKDKLVETFGVDVECETYDEEIYN